MRIITGSARGRKLKTPRGLDVRPTSDAVKEAIFSAVQFDIEGKVVLDLFAGTGQLGIEALSRGAKYAYFVDNNSESISIVRENIKISGFTEKSEVSSLSAGAFLKKTPVNFDIAFLDPPYGQDLIKRILLLLTEKMNENGIIICEHEREYKLDAKTGGFGIKKTYPHGKTSVTIYKKMTEENEVL